MDKHPGLAHIHALKFYSMAHSLDSFVRIGQELVDDFVGRRDYIGARDVIERFFDFNWRSCGCVAAAIQSEFGVADFGRGCNWNFIEIRALCVTFRVRDKSCPPVPDA